MHRSGVSHRDLKPENIMLARTVRGTVAYVVDFGIAKVGSPEDRAGSGETATASGASAYTLPYAAPEQVSRMRTGPWTDVHALGLILTEALVGRRPYEGADDAELHRSVVAEERPTPARFGVDVGALEAVLARAVAYAPARRYPDATGLLADLQAMAIPRGSTPVRGARAQVGRAWRDPTGATILLARVPAGPQTRAFFGCVFPLTVGEFQRFVEAEDYATELERAGHPYTWRSPGFERATAVDWVVAPGTSIALPKVPRGAFSSASTWTQDEDHPAVLLTRADLDAYGRWAGLRLFTEPEWDYAARGSPPRRYPWGEEAPDHTRLNAAGPRTRRFMMEHGAPTWPMLYAGDDRWPTTSPVGSFPAGRTPEGLHDMLGNVWERTVTPDGVGEVFRGCSWFRGDPATVHSGARAVARTVYPNWGARFALDAE
jgi:formylglycine-generating enzyme required for sulfatase activity